MSIMSEHELILREAGKIVEALAETLEPLCEVVLHDLKNPDKAIVKIENNISGRSIGEPATELGLARISDPEFPDKLVNYANTLSDGRQVKSTSIGLKDSSGKYVAAVCLNLDVSYLNSLTNYISKLTAFSNVDGVSEKIVPPSGLAIEEVMQSYALSKNKELRALNSAEKRELILQLKSDGMLELRGSVDIVAKLLGGSRSSIYYYVQG